MRREKFWTDRVTDPDNRVSITLRDASGRLDCRAAAGGARHAQIDWLLKSII